MTNMPLRLSTKAGTPWQSKEAAESSETRFLSLVRYQALLTTLGTLSDYNKPLYAVWLAQLCN